MPVKCFLLEPTDQEWRSDNGHVTAPLYRHPETGELMTFAQAPAGAMVRFDWATWCRSQDDGAPLVIKLPDGDLWYVDGAAGNCGRQDDPNQEHHHCWVRHGVVPNITVDKNGPTCSAGAGSIQSTRYHGFLRDGYLTIQEVFSDGEPTRYLRARAQSAATDASRADAAADA